MSKKTTKDSLAPRMRASRIWWRCEGSDLASAVAVVCNTLDKNDSYRRTLYQMCLTAYEGRPVQLDNAAYYSTSLGERLMESPLYNLIRSACDTVKADIAGRQKPKPMFITTGGDWRARRKAKKLDKFVEGQLSQRQGRYANGWEVMQDAFHDSSKLGFGAVKVSIDTMRKRINIDRVFPWELFVDPEEARYGDPQNMFHIFPMEKDLVIETFVDLDKEGNPVDDENARMMYAIETARPAEYETARVMQKVKIYEAWRLPLSKESPGKHVIAVDGCVLFEEDWTYEGFPIVALWWERDTVGYWGQGIAQAHMSQHVETNRAAQKLQDRIAICSTKRTYYDPDAVKLDDLQEGGSSEMLIACKDMARAPREVPTNPAAPQEFEWVQMNIDRFFALSGVSQSSASAQKEPGVTAAVAMQTLNDIATVRFMPKARGYEEAFVTLGRLIVNAADTLADLEGGYLVNWPGKRFIQSIDWREVSMADDMYDIRVAPISMYSRDPAAMLQIAQDLHTGGIINRETFLQMTSLPDLEGLMNRETAEREYLEELFARYMDATDDEELLELGGYEAPEPFMSNKPAAMWLAVSSYWEAKRDGAPMFCLELLQRWISQLDTLISAQSAPPAPPEAPGAIMDPSMATPEAPGMLPPGAVLPPG